MRPKPLLLALAAILSGPAAAAAAPMEVAAALQKAQLLAADNDCPAALATLEPLLGETTGREHEAVQAGRLLCLLRVGRLDEGAAAHRELLAASPDNPVVRSFGLLLAAAQGRFADSADQLAAIATDAPRLLGGFNSQLWTSLSRELTREGDYARRYRTALALARANWQPADGTDISQDLSGDAVRALIADGKAGEAEPFLADIDRPEELLRMAGERRYAALWPAIEERLGPRGEKAIGRFASRSLSALATAAGDPRTRREAIEAFEMLNRHEDADLLSRQVTIDEAMGEDDFTAVLYGAAALVASGNADGALDRLRALARLDPDKSPVAANGRLYLARWLQDLGHNDEALAVAREGLAHPQRYNAFGLAWLRRAEGCALYGLGRVDEAGASIAAIRVADNPGAAIETMLCTGRFAEASAAAVATLSDAEQASRLIAFLQPGGAQLFFIPTPTDAAWAKLAADPAVKAAFARVGRALPRDYWPAPGEQPLPRLPNRAKTV
ncbi:hypothetical protein [Sphingomonas quercus]|uniref:Tetratricopeptide repeat protein n=1 Tax=Sphingomonas quercus TaxID=2842451 RepID=A0ABS6BEN1_9SPHN|nr:hypothetical protein [Sphingomonas quercus]MBU3076286.1 hypothetical protein [Sphingomonas quercus]